ncbi:MAG: hypothetical protein AABP62_00365 [Planctomycetota bacterium]
MARRSFLNRLGELGIDHYVQMSSDTSAGSSVVEFRLRESSANELAPGIDTTQLCRKLNLDTRNNPGDLEREILLAMLLCPIPFEFPSFDELMSAVRIRKNIVEAARKTALAFATAEAERPADYWGYSKDRGFVVLPGKPLVEALRKATQPDHSGSLYSFSCYRATEYVIALGVAQEVTFCNPELAAKLQRQAETRAIKSGEFHRVFCREYGSRTEPLPLRYFVPGDRTWFRNPDSHSSDASGYEGSWVFYLGDCLFTNFWKRDKTFSLTSKCLEIFHWRNATFRDAEGELRIDESVVEARVQATLKNPVEVEQILQRMERLYDPAGVYAEGGCIDISREYPRWVCPGTTDLVLPDTEQN